MWYRLGVMGLFDPNKEEMMRSMDIGILMLLADPENTLGAMGQEIADTVDEEGLAYSVSYVISSVALDIFITKKLGGLSESSKPGDGNVGNRYCLTGEAHFKAYQEMFGAANVEWVSRYPMGED